MKESRLKKDRLCKSCGKKVHGDAAKLQEHVDEHRLADRAAKSGLILPNMDVVTL